MKYLFRTKAILCLLLVFNPIQLIAATVVQEVDPATAVISNWFAENPRRAMPAGAQRGAFSSPTANADVGYSVYLPPGYTDSSTTTYPVIYWLHGAGSNEVREILWLAPILQSAITQNLMPPVIVVFPNAGGSTMWCDTYDKTLLTETIFINELLPLIQTKFRTIKKRSARFLEGFSMGGFGAAHYLFKYPATFSSAVTYGAAYSTNETIITKDEFIPAFGGNIDYFSQNNPATFAGIYASGTAVTRFPVTLKMVVGTADVTREDNRTFRDELITLGVNPDYLELANYQHTVEPYYKAVGVAGFNFHFQ
ncbi:MAG: alpha/beta hydrolase [Methylococcaceae bacterium]